MPTPINSPKRPAARANIATEQLVEYCARWRIRELALFGSALRDDFSESSDLDFLVSFEPDAAWSLLDHILAEEELSALCGRPVDLVTRRAVEASGNPIRRRQILDGALVLYASR